MTSLLTGLALCCLLAHARGLRRFSYPFSLAVPSPFLSFSLSLSPLPLFLSLSDNSRSQPQHTVAEEPVCARARARMHGATATTAATTPMHFRTHTRSRSRALSTDCDHCRSSTIPRLVPLALARPPPPLPVVPFPYSASHSRSRVLHTNFLSLANFSCLFRIALSLLPTARLSLSTTLDISPRIPLLSATLPSPSSFPHRRTPHCSTIPYTLLLFFRFTVSPGSRSFLYSLPRFRLFLSLVLSFWPPSFPPVCFPLDDLLRPPPPWHTGQPAWFTVQFATLVPSLLLSPSFTRAQRTRCSRTGARECNV